MDANKQVFKGKWGYYAISYETLKKLRFLNVVFLKALRRAAAWKRWEWKAPHNRVRRVKLRRDGWVVGYGESKPWPEPELCPVFSEKVTKHTNWHPARGYFKDGIDYIYVETRGRNIPEAARQARMPVATAEEVRPLSYTTEEIDALYEKAKAWVDSLK